MRRVLFCWLIRGSRVLITARAGMIFAREVLRKNQWVDEKNRLVSTVERGPDGAALANPEFVVGSVGFNALVAFNAREMATVTGDESMAEAANQLVAALDLRWVEPLATWVDTGGGG